MPWRPIDNSCNRYSRLRKGPGEFVASAAATDFDYDSDEIEFIKAMDEYKRTRNRPFPTLCEHLQVLKSLGYRKP